MYSEIDNLKNDFDRFKVKISAPIDVFRKDLFFVEVNIVNNS